MARLYDPTSGSIFPRRPGHPFRSSGRARRARYGVIPQEPFLFTGTVRDNIRVRERRIRKLLDRAVHLPF